MGYSFHRPLIRCHYCIKTIAYFYFDECLQVWSRWQSGSSCPSPPETSSRGSADRSHQWRTLWSCPGWPLDLPVALGHHWKSREVINHKFTHSCNSDLMLLWSGSWPRLWLLSVMSQARYKSAPCYVRKSNLLVWSTTRWNAIRISLALVTRLAKQESYWTEM